MRRFVIISLVLFLLVDIVLFGYYMLGPKKNNPSSNKKTHLKSFSFKDRVIYVDSNIDNLEVDLPQAEALNTALEDIGVWRKGGFYLLTSDIDTSNLKYSKLPQIAPPQIAKTQPQWKGATVRKLRIVLNHYDTLQQSVPRIVLDKLSTKNGTPICIVGLDSRSTNPLGNTVDLNFYVKSDLLENSRLNDLEHDLSLAVLIEAYLHTHPEALKQTPSDIKTAQENAIAIMSKIKKSSFIQIKRR